MKTIPVVLICLCILFSCKQKEDKTKEENNNNTDASIFEFDLTEINGLQENQITNNDLSSLLPKLENIENFQGDFVGSCKETRDKKTSISQLQYILNFQLLLISKKRRFY